MTVQEFSNEFDTFYNNVTSNQAPGLDEYEKSVFLTKAQKIIVRRQFDPVSDNLREGFDGSQQRQYDFSTLLVTQDLVDVTNSTSNSEKIDNRSAVFIWPVDCFLGVNEIVVDKKGNQYSVNPISYSAYANLMTKPYQFPPKRIAWRMMTNNKASQGTLIEVLGRFQKVDGTLSTKEGIDKYTLRYVKTLSPIILVNLEDEGLSIDGVNTVSECELPVECHQEILELAVSLAKVAMLGSTETLASRQTDNKE